MLIILNTGDVVFNDTKIPQISSAGAKQRSATETSQNYPGRDPDKRIKRKQHDTLSFSYHEHASTSMS